jgi:hypothetical protein
VITTSTSPFLYIDWGEDEPGMTLQCWEREWVNYMVDGKLLSHLLILMRCLLVGIGWFKRVASD